MIQMPWYGKLEKVLGPSQEVVVLLLVGVILISAYLVVKGDAVKRTGWLVYLLSP